MVHEARESKMPQSPNRGFLQALASGLFLGILFALGFAVVVMAGAIVVAFPILLVVGLGFGSLDRLLGMLVLLAAGGLLGLALIGFLATWILRRFARVEKTPAVWAGLAGGLALALVGTFLLAPEPVRDSASTFFTGQSLAQRRPLPSTPEETRHLREVIRPQAAAGDAHAQFVLAMALMHGASGEDRDPQAAMRYLRESSSQPDGIEARLALAVRTRLESPFRGGHVLSAQEIGAKVDALLAERPALPAGWQPVVLGTAALLRQGGYDGGGKSMQVLLEEAGAAGSRLFLVYAGQMHEEAAAWIDRSGRDPAARTALQQAVDAYARAGDVFELERLREHPAGGELRFPETLPPALPRQPDPVLSSRLAEFAALLGARSVAARAAAGDKQLATTAALVAIERADDPLAFRGQDPVGTWLAGADRSPLERWLLILRHAHGDCAPALMLADLPWRAVTRSGRIRSLAWAERAAACATAPDERRRAEDLIQNMRGLSQMAPIQRAEVVARAAAIEAMLESLR